MRLSGVGFFAVVAIAAGCAGYPREVPEASVQTFPALWQPVVTNGVGGAARGSWWSVLGDDVLDRLVAQGLAGNLSLRAAWHRLEQSGYAARSSRAAFFPQVTLQGGVGQQRQIVRDSATETTDLWTVSGALSYEIDVWRRISASASSATYRFEASAMDYEAMAISMAAAIVDAWLDLQESAASLVLLRSQLLSARDALTAVERRFQEGLGILLDVYQQRELVAGLEALVPEAEVAGQLARERLALLLGIAPDALPVEPDGVLPAPVLLPRNVAWSEHIVVRPDVQAAWLRLQSSDRDRLAADRARLPILRVSAQVGTREERAEDLFEEMSGDALLQVSLPLFEGGRLQAEADRIAAVADERLQQYRDTELQALREIRESLLREAGQARTVALRREELAAARRTLEASLERYRNGLVEYLNVLAAQQRVQALERGLLRAQRQLLAYQVQFARATAGQAARIRR